MDVFKPLGCLFVITFKIFPMTWMQDCCANVSHLEITEVVLLHCNVVNNDYQQDSKEKYAFVLNKSFGQFLDILPKTIIFLKAFNS